MKTRLRLRCLAYSPTLMLRPRPISPCTRAIPKCCCRAMVGRWVLPVVTWPQGWLAASLLCLLRHPALVGGSCFPEDSHPSVVCGICGGCRTVPVKFHSRRNLLPWFLLPWKMPPQVQKVTKEPPPPSYYRGLVPTPPPPSLILRHGLSKIPEVYGRGAQFVCIYGWVAQSQWFGYDLATRPAPIWLQFILFWGEGDETEVAGCVQVLRMGSFACCLKERPVRDSGGAHACERAVEQFAAKKKLQGAHAPCILRLGHISDKRGYER